MEITAKMIQALALIRSNMASMGNAVTDARNSLAEAVNILDNAGIFAAIDEATGYDIDPEPQPVSKCTCSHAIGTGDQEQHNPGCPGDAAEWGDMAYASKVPGWAEAVEAQRKMYASRGLTYKEN